jgi:hypothetical protein
MKIVIDIDNESYEHIKACKNEDVLPMGWYAISHGAPLTSDVPDINVVNINCILNKIRAEIESCLKDEEPHLCDYRYYINVGLDMALDIIDKYKSESEEI